MTVTCEERCELEQLYAKYCFFLDVTDAEGFGSTWTTDGVFRRPNASPKVGVSEDVVGIEALKKMAGQWSGDQPPSAQRARHQHWVNNLWFEKKDEETIHGHSSLMVIETEGNGATAITMGFYTDTIVRTPDGWRFKQRIATLWY